MDKYRGISYYMNSSPYKSYKINKDITTIYVSCCVACHATHKTLYKMSKEIRICKECMVELAKTHEMITPNGGILRHNIEDETISYIPLKEE